jgi:hypothetical protein
MVIMDNIERRDYALDADGSTQAGGFLGLELCSLAAAEYAVRRFDAGCVRRPWSFTPDRSRAGNASTSGNRSQPVIREANRRDT